MEEPGRSQCSTPRVGWLEGLLSVVCLCLLSSLSKVGSSQTFSQLQAGLRGCSQPLPLQSSARS